MSCVSVRAALCVSFCVSWRPVLSRFAFLRPAFRVMRSLGVVFCALYFALCVFAFSVSRSEFCVPRFLASRVSRVRVFVLFHTLVIDFLRFRVLRYAFFRVLHSAFLAFCVSRFFAFSRFAFLHVAFSAFPCCVPTSCVLALCVVRFAFPRFALLRFAFRISRFCVSRFAFALSVFLSLPFTFPRFAFCISCVRVFARRVLCVLRFRV